jgi:hypothetical protein
MEEKLNPGRAVDVAEEKGYILIPLKQKSTVPQLVEVIYSQPKAKEWRISSQKYYGPQFDLPLNNVKWDIYLPEEFNYSGFHGSLDYAGKSYIPIPFTDISSYDAEARQRKIGKKEIARRWLNKANFLSKRGRQQEANDAFRNASNLALDDKSLNEDIQGQWVAAQRKNTITLFGSRALGRILRTRRQQTSGSPGTWRKSPTLSVKERQTITSISDKIFQQQQAAAQEAQPLIFSIPENGRKITFSRRLQMQRNIPMEVAFKASSAFTWEKQSNIKAGIILTLLFAMFFAVGGRVFARESK